MWHVVGCVVLAGRVWSGWRGCGAWATPGCWPDGWCCVWLAWCDGVGGRFAAVTWVWCAASGWSVFSARKCSVRLGVWCGVARRASGGGCGGSVVVGVGGVCACVWCVLWLVELGAAGVAQVCCWWSVGGVVGVC